MPARIRFWIVPLFLVTLAGCDDILAPLFSIDAEILGPRSIIGQYAAAQSWRGLPAGYRCETTLHIRATGPEDPTRTVSWAGAEIRKTSEVDGRDLGVSVLTGQELDALFGRVTPGRTVRTRPVPVVADTLPFRWELTASFYDPHTGRNGTASFESHCRDRLS